jgi:hypothetical protein
MTDLSAFDSVVDALAEHGIRGNGTTATARCPGHGDRNPSLSLRRIDGQVLMFCHAGCDTRDVLAAVGLGLRDLYDDPKGATYRYDDGRVVHRSPDKRFRQSGNTQGRAQLYRVEKIQAAVAGGETIYLVEGEKDVHALESVGVIATTNPMGAANWATVDPAPLHGGRIVVIPDRDEAGKRWARDVLATLDGICQSVQVMLAKVGKDAADHVAAGHTLKDLILADLDVADDQDKGWSGNLQDGGAFLFDGPEEVEPIWGRGDEVLWAEGEALIVAGPPGVGKTTLAGQVVRARLGFADQVLGYPVWPTGSKVLYLAMDRPRQIRRSLLRQFRPEDRATADARLVVWKGPPPFDLAKFPGLLLDLARKAGADTVIVDSLKDAFIGLTDDEAAAGYNRARQTALVKEVEVLELHHQRKSGANNAAPVTLDDLYGSVWISSGAGSVVLLWGTPGDLIVQLRHLKQPAAEVGPFHILHDHDSGTSSIHRGADLVRLATIAGVDGLTVKAAAAAIFDTDKPTDSQIEKARRRLRSLARPGGALVGQGGGRTGSPVTYRAAIRALENEVTGVTQGVTHPSGRDRVTTPPEGSRPSRNPQVTGVTVGVTGVTVPGGSRIPPAYRQGDAPLPFMTVGATGRCVGCGAPIDPAELGGEICDDCALEGVRPA